MSKWLRRILIGIVSLVMAVGIGVGCTVACIGGTTGVILGVHDLGGHGMEEISTPLEADTVTDLCQKLTFTQKERKRLCSEGATVYAPEFFGPMVASLKIGTTTYQEAEEILGPYRYRCEPPVSWHSGSISATTYRCDYDFRGDRVFGFSLDFTDEDVLYWIIADAYD